MGCISSKLDNDGEAHIDVGVSGLSAPRTHPCAAPLPASAWDAPPSKHKSHTCSSAAAHTSVLLSPRDVLELAQQLLEEDERLCSLTPALGGPGAGSTATSGNWGNQLAASGAQAVAALPAQQPFSALGVSALMLAALALIESGGRPGMRQFREHLGGTSIGLCQMLLSTARWLAAEQGYTRFGLNPSSHDLEHPPACLYYCAAYLAVLATSSGGSDRSGGNSTFAPEPPQQLRLQREDWVVRAFHCGPKAANSAEAGAYWEKYATAKCLLARLGAALERQRRGAPGAFPCTMHIVAAGETLYSIAAIVGTSLDSLLEANPELRVDPGGVQPGDCIALPVPVVLPRLHVLQPGDTPAAVARSHGVPLGRLLALNPGMRELRRVSPGWLLAVPGLKGDSQWLLSWEDVTAASPVHQGGRGAGGRRRDVTAGTDQDAGEPGVQLQLHWYER